MPQSCVIYQVGAFLALSFEKPVGQPVSEHATKAGFIKDAGEGDSFSAVSQ